MLPDLLSLQCFVALAQDRQFRRAARSVALSPAAFSDRISRLEDELGVVLVRRTPRQVGLTEAGERLLPHARELLSGAQRARAVARGDEAASPWELIVGTRFELGLSWLVPAWLSMRASRPERTMQLAFSSGPDLMDGLQRGLLDAVITSARLTRAYDYAELHPERYAFVGSRRLVERQPFSDRSQAVDHVLVDTNPGLPLFRYFLESLDEPSLWSFRDQLFVGAIAAVRTVLLTGEGVGVLPTYYIGSDLAEGTLVRLFPNVVLKEDAFRLVWRARDPRAERFRALAGELSAFPLG